VAAKRIDTNRRGVVMDRVVCQFCNAQNDTGNTHCENCGALLDIKDRISDPGSSAAPGSKSLKREADALASGPRVPAVIKSFQASGTTPRTRQWAACKPELLDAPDYWLTVDIRFPDKPPVTKKYLGPVPPAQVPNLAVGRTLTCAIEQVGTSYLWWVDWSIAPTEPPPTKRWGRR
jgi:hypothetical protein